MVLASPCLLTALISFEVAPDSATVLPLVPESEDLDPRCPSSCSSPPRAPEVWPRPWIVLRTSPQLELRRSRVGALPMLEVRSQTCPWSWICLFPLPWVVEKPFSWASCPFWALCVAEGRQIDPGLLGSQHTIHRQSRGARGANSRRSTALETGISVMAPVLTDLSVVAGWEE